MVCSIYVIYTHSTILSRKESFLGTVVLEITRANLVRIRHDAVIPSFSDARLLRLQESLSDMTTWQAVRWNFSSPLYHLAP